MSRPADIPPRDRGPAPAGSRPRSHRGADPEQSSSRDWGDPRVWLLAAAAVGIAALNIALPQIVLEPFLLIPVLVSAAIAGPTVTATLAALAIALAALTGLASGYGDDANFWLRLLVMAGAALVGIDRHAGSQPPSGWRGKHTNCCAPS